METTEIKVRLIKHEGAESKMPKKATAGSAGYDLCAAISAPLTIEPGALVKVPTGVAIALPGPENVALIYARSGLAIKHGITLPNCVGVIDSDYRGELIVGLCNISRGAYTISPGERIAQLVITPVTPSVLTETDALDETGRSAGGFGSTGKF
jgi:dUTP pyrophosphatase